MRLSDINPAFQVTAKQAPASVPDLARMRKGFPQVPEEYLSLIQEATAIELRCEPRYLRIWHPDTCLDHADGYQMSRWLPGSVPIGDDGGGRVLMYFDGTKGWGLYRVSYGYLDPKGAVWVSASLTRLLVEKDGLENL
jgi:hypothetical protein